MGASLRLFAFVGAWPELRSLEGFGLAANGWTGVPPRGAIDMLISFPDREGRERVSGQPEHLATHWTAKKTPATIKGYGCGSFS